VAELGNVLEPEVQGPHGEDLTTTVDVPRGALGDPDGLWVDVPRKLAHAGELVERVVDEAEGERVLLRLPEAFPENGAIKFRGQGGAHDTGPPGDLILRVHLTDELFEGRGPESSHLREWVVLALIAAGAGAVWVFL
jgi:hypothetical protein